MLPNLLGYTFLAVSQGEKSDLIYILLPCIFLFAGFCLHGNWFLFVHFIYLFNYLFATHPLRKIWHGS